MSLIEQTLYGKINKVNNAVKLLQEYYEIALKITGNPFHVAYSGGKDSDVIRLLCEEAGVEYTLVHNNTTVEAPETEEYIKTIPNLIINQPKLNMFELIVKKRMPPTRQIRYCCSELKECCSGGRESFTITGVRRGESNKRKARGIAEIITSRHANSLIINYDNEENRNTFESCTRIGKRVINPIVEWSEEDVWEYLNYHNCKSNPLYQKGFKRVGCIGCPLTSRQIWELEQYPIIKEKYINAFDKMLKTYDDRVPITWGTGEEVFDWWIRNTKKENIMDGQLSLEGTNG